jgi:uncharacterized damage-inducible protein DinB
MRRRNPRCSTGHDGTDGAAVMERIDPKLANDEHTMLSEFLDFHRATVLRKIDGLLPSQLTAQPLASSTLTLAGLLKHLTLNEDTWFSERFAGLPAREPWASAPFDDDPDWEMHSALHDSAEELVAAYLDACERSRAVVSGRSLDDLSVLPNRMGTEHFSLRWIMVHMIEETARHNGHMDLLREALDGAKGE